jgi:hypothetical protein
MARSALRACRFEMGRRVSMLDEMSVVGLVVNGAL